LGIFGWPFKPAFDDGFALLEKRKHLSRDLHFQLLQRKQYSDVFLQQLTTGMQTKFAQTFGPQTIDIASVLVVFLTESII
jgi:hypothetical protein